MPAKSWLLSKQGTGIRAQWILTFSLNSRQLFAL
jgi:hypothetical protein